MTDQDVRDFFERLATLEPMPPSDPAPLVRRGHRRLARNLVGGALVVMVAVGALAAGASSLLTTPSRPAAPTGATSGQTPTPTGEPAASDALTGTLVPDAGPFRGDGEVLQRVCCDGAIGAVDPESGRTRVLVDPASEDVGSAAWSPDGTRLAFEILCGETGRGFNPSMPCSDERSREAGLYVVNATEEAILVASYYGSGRVYNGTSYFERHFAWSPDGSRLAFALLGEGLYVMDSDGSHTDLVGSSLDELRGPPSWAPDGSAIAYATGDGVYVVASSGGVMTQLSVDGAEPVWSPDGSRIAFSRSNAVFVVRPDGTDLARVGEGSFAWSPSGDRLVVGGGEAVDGGFSEQLWVVGADGSVPTAIVDSACCGGIVDGSLAWAPDGDRVGFLVSTANDETWRVAATDGSEVAEPLESLDEIDAITTTTWLTCLCTIY